MAYGPLEQGENLTSPWGNGTPRPVLRTWNAEQVCGMADLMGAFPGMAEAFGLRRDPRAVMRQLDMVMDRAVWTMAYMDTWQHGSTVHLQPGFIVYGSYRMGYGVSTV